MYVRIGERLADAISANSGTRATQSNLCQRSGQIYTGLGQPSTPACMSIPGWITRYKHFVSPKTRVLPSGTNKLEWQSTSRNVELRPDSCSNCKASRISRSLDLSFVNSALWQSGLYDCRWGGIWLGAHYNEYKGQNGSAIRTLTCSQLTVRQKAVIRILKEALFTAVTALSVASFFTLLAQGRLIDDYSSQKLKDILIKQPDSCGSRFKTGLENAGRFTNRDRIYSKIGVTNSISHEGALIDRVSIGKKYVAVVLTISSAGKAIISMVREKVIERLDELIETNPP